MKKITIWLTATASVLALVIAYQLNAAGVGGKAGGDTDQQSPPAAVSIGVPAPTSSNRSDSDGANTSHVGKPGENK